MEYQVLTMGAKTGSLPRPWAAEANITSLRTFSARTSPNVTPAPSAMPRISSIADGANSSIALACRPACLTTFAHDQSA